MTHCPEADRLRQLLGQEDTLVEDADLVAHLDECASCRLRLEEMGGGKADLMTAVGSLDSSSYEAEPPLRRVLDELRGDDATIVGRPVDRTSWVQRLLRPVKSLDGLGEIGGYEVTEILGQGSMGLVLKARDPALKRWVALKVLAPDLAGDDVARQRFAREAQAAAAIHHQNVTTIFHVSEDNGLPYFVMEYVRGGSLQDYLDKHGPADWRTVTELGAEAAEGLAAAHANGLVHRDIKPSNIMLADGHVKIGDFGLARVADESRLTQTGIVAGTPMYMSPEQAEGKPLDSRADLFSLGSLLYALCTGREPFLAASPLAVLRQVCEGTPKPIRDLNPDVPDWLADCIERLQAKLPDDRFTNATEVAELLRYNLDHPDAPRRAPPSPRRRAQRFRPVRMSFIASGVVLVLTLAGLALSRSWHKVRPDASNPLPLLVTLDAHTGPVLSLAYSPDGQTLATGGDDRTLRLWDPATGRQKAELPSHTSPVTSIAFAHSGKFLVSPDGDGTIRVWSFETGQETRLSPKLGSSSLRRLTLSPDDRTLVVILNSSPSVAALDVETGEVRYTVAANSSSILSVAFAPHREILATGTSGRIQFWNANTGTEEGEEISDPTPLRVTQLAFTPDGDALASSRIGDKEIKLWSLDRSELIRSFSGGEDVVSMAICKDGRLLAAGSSDGTVRLWTVADGELLATLHAHQGRVQLAFSPDSRTLATAGDDHLVKIWDLSSLNP